VPMKEARLTCTIIPSTRHPMSKSPPSHATPIMLSWARKRAGFPTVESAAAALKLDEAKIEDWEQGKGTPSFSQLERLAQTYKHPMMVFYLEEPPKGFAVVKDFRVAGGAGVGAFSPALAAAIKSAQERQAWASSYLQSEGSEKVKFVGSQTVSDDARKVGDALRKLLRVPLEEQVRVARDNEAFSLWRRRIEDAGVFVFSASRIDVSEMRGCALTDDYAPTVVVNSKDSYTARVFTLMHEMAHILIGSTSLSGAIDAESLFDGGKTERFCNSVAAESLVPVDDFRSLVPASWKQKTDDVLRTLSRRYWVSRAVIALRLVEAGFADKSWLRSILPTLLGGARESTGFVPQHTMALSRNGEKFSRLAISAFQSGEIHGGDLASLLNMRLQHLGQLQSHLYPMNTKRAPDAESA
jgi:Zn-dependent peptidase ImmA (M78 family)